MNPIIETWEHRLARLYCAAYERELVRLFEEAEGRVPTNVEVARHANVLCWPTGQRDIQWKGKTIGRFPNAWDWARANLP